MEEALKPITSQDWKTETYQRIEEESASKHFGKKRMKLPPPPANGQWGDYEGYLDSDGKACGLGTWTRPDNMIWVGEYKNDGGNGKITFYDSGGEVYN